MTVPLRALILEDNDADVELMLRELRREGFDIAPRVVQERPHFVAALEPGLDIILVDFNLPQYDAIEALRDLAAADIVVPAIVVTGSLSDEAAVRCMQEGAADYLMKDRLARLGPAVTRAIRERDLRAENRRAELAERQTRQRLQAIFSSSREAIFVADSSGRYLDVNPAAEKLTGYARDELLTLSVHDVTAKTASFDPAERWATFVNDGSQSGECILLARDGTLPLAEYQAVANIVEGVHLSVMRDITQRKNTEEALLSAQKLESLGVLAGGVAHDFNNLLVAILGNADMALAELPAEAPAIDAIRQIKVAARRSADLARQMLALSGRGRFVTERIDLNGLVQEMTHLLAASIGRGVTIRYQLAPSVLTVEADATQLRQIVMNLVVNASDAIGTATGAINVITGVMHLDRRYLTETFLAPDLPEGDYVFLEVADTGSGMDAETQKKIFDPFFTTKFAGRGLGLSAVLGILRSHRGTIKVYSEPSRGTTFKVLLPAIEVDTVAAEEDTSANRDWFGRGTVLVVDDDRSVRHVAARALERFGFDVLLANDGHEAVAIYEEHLDAICLVLLDMTMPYLTGEETFRELRRINPDARVVIMTGYTEQDTVGRFAGKGLAGFVQKPFELTTLRATLREALES
ncbi:MAG TPA: response regulator [Tepidiformaceae bacterium]|nr:response regulator [Tepidiformaceae bacterium]